MKTVLIIAAKSDIAKAVAAKYAQKGYGLYLAARKADELADFAQHLRIKTQQEITCFELDILDTASHADFYQQFKNKPQGVICAAGYLGDQLKAQTDFNEAQQIINTNFTGIMSLLNIIANDFEQRKGGFIVGISSVAGDRGRKSNYIYGAAKAGFSAYLSGLRNRLYENKVSVLTVKPGFVATQMTAGMDLPAKLTAQPEAVADDIYNAQQKNRNILYTKGLWRWIMLIIKNIPEWQFKKMSL